MQRAQIWEPRFTNPAMGMPAFGRHQALSEVDKDAIVDDPHNP